MVECDTLNQLLIYLTILGNIAFFISEGLAWSSCRANSVSELLIGRCFGYDWFIKKVQVEESQTLPKITVTLPDSNDRDNQTTIDRRNGDQANREGSSQVGEAA